MRDGGASFHMIRWIVLALAVSGFVGICLNWKQFAWQDTAVVGLACVYLGARALQSILEE